MSVPAVLVPPLADDQAALLARLTEDLDTERLWWLSGYMAGLARARPGGAQATVAPVPAAVPGPLERLTIVYGSQTGNAKRLAERLTAQAAEQGVPARLLRADAYPLRELKTERLLYLVISTQGDGDPPDDSRDLVDFLLGARAPALKGLAYAVLSLGDSSYPQFCAIGRRLDERLQSLGAQRLLARGDADVDIDTVAAPWLAQALTAARGTLKPAAPRLGTVTALRSSAPVPAGDHREHPLHARVLANQRITGRAAAAEVRHLELAFDEEAHYAPGDALGVWPRHPPQLVDAVLAAARLDGDSEVTRRGQTLPLRAWLGERLELTRLARPFLETLAQRSGDADLQTLLADADPAALGRLVEQRQVLDALQEWPVPWTAETLVAALRPLAPRLYSIASSQREVEGEVHLALAPVHHRNTRGERWGAASHTLAHAAEGGRLRVFFEPNERFRLPADAARDVIMIGAGTGIAPFRAFLQERTAAGTSGRHWLLFGNRQFREDFLYQREWQEAQRRGRLQRIDLAFSRDRAAKVYVQDRVRERGRELFAWIEGGAYVYVCGSTRMGDAVHQALLDAVAAQRGGDAEAAREYLQALRVQGRYARDVY